MKRFSDFHSEKCICDPVSDSHWSQCVVAMLDDLAEAIEELGKAEVVIVVKLKKDV